MSRYVKEEQTFMIFFSVNIWIFDFLGHFET